MYLHTFGDQKITITVEGGTLAHFEGGVEHDEKKILNPRRGGEKRKEKGGAGRKGEV